MPQNYYWPAISQVRTFRWFFIAFMALLSTLATAASHCYSGESTYFSCPIAGSKKVVSLCGSADLLSKLGDNFTDSWLQYRFGVPGTPELIYPQKKTGSVETFTASWSQHKPISKDDTWGIDDNISFTSGSAEYMILVARYESESYGVSATHDGKQVFFPCAGASATRYATVGDTNGKFSRLVRILAKPG